MSARRRGGAAISADERGESITPPPLASTVLPSPIRTRPSASLAPVRPINRNRSAPGTYGEARALYAEEAFP